MTSSPDLNDVVGDVNKTKSGLNSRKSSDLSPERNYHKNGTGLMRDGSIDGNIHCFVLYIMEFYYYSDSLVEKFCPQSNN